MTGHLEQVEQRLLDVMAAAERGPTRNGIFALWLVVRQCGGMLPPEPLAQGVSRRRLERLERRLSSLSLPAPLRRALPASVREIRDARPGGAAVALQQLVAPAREALGAPSGDALALAARAVRSSVQGDRLAEEGR